MIRIQKILDSMKNQPEDWENNHFTLKNVKTDTEIWIANGFFAYGIHKPKEVSFTFLEKIFFSLTLHEWKKSNAPKDFWDKLV